MDQVLNSAFNFVVLAAEFLGFDSNPLLLHLNELIKSVSLGILWQVDQDSLGEGLEVVLNSVLHNVIDVDNKLLKFGEALMNMSQVTINVHRCPGKGNHTRAELVLKIFKMWNQQ